MLISWTFDALRYNHSKMSNTRNNDDLARALSAMSNTDADDSHEDVDDADDADAEVENEISDVAPEPAPETAPVAQPAARTESRPQTSPKSSPVARPVSRSESRPESRPVARPAVAVSTTPAPTPAAAPARPSRPSRPSAPQPVARIEAPVQQQVVSYAARKAASKSKAAAYATSEFRRTMIPSCLVVGVMFPLMFVAFFLQPASAALRQTTILLPVGILVIGLLVLGVGMMNMMLVKKEIEAAQVKP